MDQVAMTENASKQTTTQKQITTTGVQDVNMLLAITHGMVFPHWNTGDE